MNNLIAKYIRIISFGKTLTLTLTVKLVLMIIFATIENVLQSDYIAQEFQIDITVVIITIVITPIIETFIFQFMPFFLMSQIYYFRTHYYWIIAISALLFASTHYYSLLYFVYAIICGAIYSSIYVEHIGLSLEYTQYIIWPE